MPSLFIGNKSAQTLEITLEDKISGAKWFYRILFFDDYDVIFKKIHEIHNISDSTNRKLQRIQRQISILLREIMI